MSNNDNAQKSDSPVAGPSGTRRINFKRPRRLYSSSEEDAEDEDTYPIRSPKRICVEKDISDQRFDYLQKQVSELKYLLTRNSRDITSGSHKEAGLIDEPLSADECDNVSISSSLIKPVENDFLQWDDDTVASESMKRTSESKLNHLRKVQHLDSNQWNNVRYTDVQKKYLTTPGFTNLTLNDELMAFESKFNHLRSLDQTFGALTGMLLSQKEALQASLKQLLDWAEDKDTNLSKAVLSTKVRELFSNTCKYTDISKDILQIVCGRRANMIEHRRDSALSAVKDKYNKTILRRIPPSAEYLFQPKEFSDAVAKLGGGSRVFRKPYLPAEGSQAMQANNRLYLPAEGNQAALRRPSDHVPFRSYNRNKNQQATASGKGKSLAGKQHYSAAKNKSSQKPRDNFRSHTRQ